MPAAYAAATSPALCPTTHAGRTPHDLSSSVSATSIMKITGWASWHSSSRSWGAPKHSSRSENPASSRQAASTASTASRKAGSVAYSSRPHPAHCVPWPAKTIMTRGSPLPSLIVAAGAGPGVAP